MNLFEHHLTIKPRQAMLKITELIQKDIEERGITEGIAVVYCPHTTAGLTVNENADPDVVSDLLYGFEKAFPSTDTAYRHFEGNSHAHMKSSVVGASAHLIISGGKLLLGTWQDVYFCEYDGPRDRTFYVKLLAG